MKSLVTSLIIITTLMLAGSALAIEGMDQAKDKAAGAMDNMDHSAMEGTYKHEETVEGVRAEFQVMSLESMNMKDEEGNTHHVMATFFKEGTDDKITDVTARAKVIAPSDAAQEFTLKDYNGVYAGNFKVDETGKWGVICLFKIDGKKRLAKFWYPHHKM